MRRQQLEKLSVQELQEYRKSLLGRNDQLRSMILVCEKEGHYLKQRLIQLRQIEYQQAHNPPAGISKLVPLSPPKHPQNHEKSEGIATLVGEYTLPVIGKVKEGTITLGKNILETGSRIGGSLWSFGSSIKSKLLGETSSPNYKNINPQYLTPIPPPQIISVPPIDQLPIYQQIIQLKSHSNASTQQQRPSPPPQTTQQTGSPILNTQPSKVLSQKSSKEESKSIIEKLDGVVSGEI